MSLGARCDYALTKRVPVDNAKNKDYRPYMSDYDLPSEYNITRKAQILSFCVYRLDDMIRIDDTLIRFAIRIIYRPVSRRGSIYCAIVRRRTYNGVIFQSFDILSQYFLIKKN